ncbi:MAG TPA: AIR synthase-related protein, partial [Phycisphaerae bacterium]|nr:AIR synthase-related protein [Phycisphaerae bacterium]
AAKNDKISQEVFAEAIEIMTKLNADAADLARKFDAHAVTDVTGFGLIGHAYQMAEASGVEIQIEAGKVPLIGPTLDLARQGMATRAWKSTLESIGEGFRAEGVEEVLVQVLADAQTSGGLLMAVSREVLGSARLSLPVNLRQLIVEIGIVNSNGGLGIVLSP